MLNQIGFDTTDEQVTEIFGGMYTTRQTEYGSFGSDWFQQVALRFGKCAADALEVPAHNWARVALKSALLAPEIYKDLLPVITPVLKMGMAL